MHDPRREGRQRFYTLNQEKVSDCCGLLMGRFAPDQALQGAGSKKKPTESSR